MILTSPLSDPYFLAAIVVCAGLAYLAYRASRPPHHPADTPTEAPPISISWKGSEVDLWDRILDRLHPEFGRDVMIAGGAVRDFLLGQPRKDIDVFIDWTTRGCYREFEKKVLPFLQAHGFPVKRKTPGYVMPGGDSSLIHAITTEMFGAEVQLLAISVPGTHFNAQDACERIDFGLCRVAYTRRSGFYRSAEFERDRENKHLTLLRSETPAQFDASLARARRILAKYPDYRVVRPDGSGIPIQ